MTPTTILLLVLGLSLFCVGLFLTRRELARGTRNHFTRR
jgi:hypothetical protein